ncbi:MAG: hypothetical protein ACOCSD_04065 [Halolamina sp.]
MDPVALLLLLGVWLFTVVALSPLLLFSSTKRPLAGWPTDWLGVNYLLAATGYTVVHVLVAFAPGIVSGSVGFGWMAVATLGLLVAWWVVLGVVVPGFGWWDPSESAGWDGRLALGTVAAGYLGFVAALLLFAALGVVAIFSRYPG